MKCEFAPVQVSEIRKQKTADKQSGSRAARGLLLSDKMCVFWAGGRLAIFCRLDEFLYGVLINKICYFSSFFLLFNFSVTLSLKYPLGIKHWIKFPQANRATVS